MGNDTVLRLLPVTVLERFRYLAEKLEYDALATRARQSAILLIAVWGIYMAAQLLWSLLPAPAPAPAIALVPAVPAPRSAAELRGAPPNIVPITSQPLFGAYQPPQATPETPQETPLELKLSGIMYSSNPDFARATIGHKNKQELYAAGDELPVAGAKVQTIARDHILIEHNGKTERLGLYDKKAKKRDKNIKRIDMRGNRNAAAAAKRYYSRLMKKPADLSKVISFSVVRKDGSIIGYRVRPRSDASSFLKLGFSSNDIVTAINDIDLDSLSALQRVHSSMRNSAEASFIILRGRKSVELLLKTH